MTTLADLEALFRSRCMDMAKPYLHSPQEVWGWLNEAEREACTRMDLLPESSDPDYVTVDVTAGTGSYAINANWCRISYAAFTPDGGDPIELSIYTDPAVVTRWRPDWRTTTEQPADIIVQQGNVRFGCLPDTDGTLTLEGYRLPTASMVDKDDTPEIPARHHDKLVHWAEFRAYSKPDPESQDLQRAQAAEAEFERYFGARPDADARQSHETPAHVRAW